jgi:hypothetical protein
MLAVLVVGLAVVPMAAEEPEVERIVMEEVKIHPDRYFDYLEAVKAFLPILAEHEYKQSFYAFEGEDNTFYFGSPVKDLAEVGRNWDAWPKFMEMVGAEKLEPLLESFTGTFEYARHSLWKSRPDLSYGVDPARWDPMEHHFRRWGFLYVKGGMEQQFEATMKKFVDLFAEKNANWAWDTYVGEFGSEMPVYVYVEIGPGPGEFWTEATKVSKSLEKESMEIWVEMLPTLRRVEYISATFRPDLSSFPATEEATEAD